MSARRYDDDDASWLRARAVEQMQHRSVAAGFRRGKLTGKHPSELRAAAHRRATRSYTTGQIVVGAGVVTAGFFLGRYLGRKLKEKRAAGAEGTYVQGLDVLGAR